MITGQRRLAKKLKEDEIVGERQRTLKFYFRPRWHPRGHGICAAALQSTVITYNQSQDYVGPATPPGLPPLTPLFPFPPSRTHTPRLEFSSRKVYD